MCGEVYNGQNPSIGQFQIANRWLREAAIVDSTVNMRTTMDQGSLPACLVASRKSQTENVCTTMEIVSVVVDTTY
jgi:hypothetical protein